MYYTPSAMRASAAGPYVDFLFTHQTFSRTGMLAMGINALLFVHEEACAITNRENGYMGSLGDTLLYLGPKCLRPGHPPSNVYNVSAYSTREERYDTIFYYGFYGWRFCYYHFGCCCHPTSRRHILSLLFTENLNPFPMAPILFPRKCSMVHYLPDSHDCTYSHVHLTGKYRTSTS